MSTFEMGPDKTGDLRTARSYFLIPLLGPDPAGTGTHHRDRIVQFLQQRQTCAPPVTDIYVLSHGWHRNFFSAVGAYDRLISRFTVLFQRERITPKSEPYCPLFLAMHWNSDPDPDGWVDTAGRRDKTTFLENAWALFEPSPDVSEGVLYNTLEDIYEYMTYVSAPDVPLLANAMDDRAGSLFQRLAAQARVRGHVGTVPPATPEDKTSLAWRCYNEATPERVLLGQSEEPQPYSNSLQAVANLFKFLVAALGLTTLLGLLPKVLTYFHVWPYAQEWGHAAINWPLHLPGVGKSLLASPPALRTLALTLILLVLLVIVALSILRGTMFWQERLRPGQGGRGLPVLAVGSWLPLQVLVILPLLLYLFATFLFRTWVVLLSPVVYLLGRTLHMGRFWPTALFVAACAVYSFLAARFDLPLRSLFNERVPPGTARLPWHVRDYLAALARKPIGWLRRAVAADSQASGLGDVLDSQLAFWEMQRCGALAGREAGAFLAALLPTLAENQCLVSGSARMHLVGHSFGGLLLANAARTLADTPVKIDSLILLQAAMASAWFKTEAWCRNADILRSTLACIYSAYDVANGFYYPAVNNSRLAAGYVGLCNVGSRTGTAQTLGKDGLFASLVQPPDLTSHLEGGAPYAINLDASRLIYAGSLAAGGGHDDIYKDDVIHMIWAVTALAHSLTPMPSPPNEPPGV